MKCRTFSQNPRTRGKSQHHQLALDRQVTVGDSGLSCGVPSLVRYWIPVFGDALLTVNSHKNDRRGDVFVLYFTEGYKALVFTKLTKGRGGVSLVGGASDRHAAEAGSNPRCGKRFFSPSQLSVQTLTVSVHPHMQSHALTSVGTVKIL